MAGLIVHEWIEPSGGAEKVLDAMLDSFPLADVHCLWNDNPGKHPNRVISESFLARTHLRRRKALAVPVMPSIWRNLKFSDDYEWTLASSHLFAHHARLKVSNPPYRRYVYAHTPARYLWAPELDARGAGLFPRMGAALLKPIDKRAAHQNTSIAANSLFVRERIASTWEVDAQVIYPPVDVTRVQSIQSWADVLSGPEQEQLDLLPSEFLLGASRFVPYKRLDLVIEIGSQAGIPVVIAGSGPEEQRLRELAKESPVPVWFVIDPSDEMLFALYQRTLVYVFPSVEDFGIMPVEAMAAGAPVLVNATGGAAESVVDGITGFHLADFSRASIRSVLEKIHSLKKEDIMHRAREFSRERFITELHDWIVPSSKPNALQTTEGSLAYQA